MHARKWLAIISVPVLLGALIAACASPAPRAIDRPVIQTPIVGEQVEKVATQAVVGTVEKVATPTAAPTVLPAADKGVMTVSKEQYTTWVRNFNPLLPDPQQRFPTRAGIYEPLLIYNVMTAQYVPWLATRWDWSEENTQVTFTIRDNVKWSDGEPFTARDVAFTFNLMKQVSAFDNFSVWAYLTSVTAPDSSHVVFKLSQAYVPGLPDIGQQPIVPAHIWKDVKDPEKFANENPVGTGPFTEVRTFADQLYVLCKNPNYWQPGKPGFDCMRFPTFSSNQQANQALLNGEIDWAGNFIADAGKTYVTDTSRYWFPPVGGLVYLYLNTQKKPFDDPNVRKAISMAIDRNWITDMAMYDYTQPADATGLGPNAAKWKDQAIARSGNWTAREVAAANDLLDQAGLKRGADGIRIAPDGSPMRYDLNVVDGWTDWVSTCDIISRNLQEIGIDAPVKGIEFDPWFDMVTRGNFSLSLGWSTSMPFPYNIYKEQMSCSSVQRIGDTAGENWHRYCNKDATTLLKQLADTADENEQMRITKELEQIFVDNAPAIPLFAGPSWGEYNTKRFTNWPNEGNPYAKLTPNDPPGTLLVLTNVKAR